MNDVQSHTHKQILRRTILSFAVFILFGIACYVGWNWLQSQPNVDGVKKPIRTVLNKNGEFFQSTSSHGRLAKTFPDSMAAKKTRVNGSAGMNDDFNAANWKLKVVRNPGDTLFISLDEIKKLPKTKVTFNFKCIEGWSQINSWSGVKFSDFIKFYHLTPQSTMEYVGLITPDNGYYVGIDMKSATHPQTLLCYELNGKPLPMNQGYPLRLIIPVKYGIKSLKRIGTISFSNSRPRDYWAEKGYDYYSGL